MQSRPTISNQLRAGLAVTVLLMAPAIRANAPDTTPNDGVDNLELCPNSDGCASCGTGSGMGAYTATAHGMPVWSVSDPYLKLRVRDVPLDYRPAKGPPVAFELRNNQRETVAGLATDVFSIGARWNCAWLSYVSTGPTWQVLLPGGGLLALAYDTPELFTGRGPAGHQCRRGLRPGFPGRPSQRRRPDQPAVHLKRKAAEAAQNDVTIEDC